MYKHWRQELLFVCLNLSEYKKLMHHPSIIGFSKIIQILECIQKTAIDFGLALAILYGDGCALTPRGPWRAIPIPLPRVAPPRPRALPRPRPRPCPLPLSLKPLFLIRSSNDISKDVAIQLADNRLAKIKQYAMNLQQWKGLGSVSYDSTTRLGI